MRNYYCSCNPVPWNRSTSPNSRVLWCEREVTNCRGGPPYAGFGLVPDHRICVRRGNVAVRARGAVHDVAWTQNPLSSDVWVRFPPPAPGPGLEPGHLAVGDFKSDRAAGLVSQGVTLVTFSTVCSSTKGRSFASFARLCQQYGVSSGSVGIACKFPPVPIDFPDVTRRRNPPRAL
jgi:hypothetical protein